MDKEEPSSKQNIRLLKENKRKFSLQRKNNKHDVNFCLKNNVSFKKHQAAFTSAFSQPNIYNGRNLGIGISKLNLYNDPNLLYNRADPQF